MEIYHKMSLKGCHGNTDSSHDKKTVARRLQDGGGNVSVAIDTEVLMVLLSIPDINSPRKVQVKL